MDDDVGADLHADAHRGRAVLDPHEARRATARRCGALALGKVALGQAAFMLPPW